MGTGNCCEGWSRETLGDQQLCDPRDGSFQAGNTSGDGNREDLANRVRIAELVLGIPGLQARPNGLLGQSCQHGNRSRVVLFRRSSKTVPQTRYERTVSTASAAVCVLSRDSLGQTNAAADVADRNRVERRGPARGTGRRRDSHLLPRRQDTPSVSNRNGSRESAEAASARNEAAWPAEIHVPTRSLPGGRRNPGAHAHEEKQCS